ncbi:GNAT family N-acetyltransferase [Flavobacteriaceae bacterium W22]|nr:GNAT family N-acetyltransferase [Flavobacteriaceae bacterium W22]
MNIRKADKTDIPFIVNAIVEIESFSGTNTFNKLFGTDTETTKNYLERFLNDDENFDTEFSLNTYTVVEFDNQRAACCSIFFTDSFYYQSKSELFAIHLEKNHLDHFIKNAKSLPDNKKLSSNKFFIEYIFVHKAFRGQRIAGKLIDYQISKVTVEKVYINVLENNENAFNAYKKLGFKEYKKVKVNQDGNRIYPTDNKNILIKKIN